jgi:hypothetical protein
MSESIIAHTCVEALLNFFYLDTKALLRLSRPYTALFFLKKKMSENIIAHTCVEALFTFYLDTRASIWTLEGLARG